MLPFYRVNLANLKPDYFRKSALILSFLYLSRFIIFESIRGGVFLFNIDDLNKFNVEQIFR
jgi:hypothetical protein